MQNMVVHCKKSPFDVYIGRPSKWGNPFAIGRDGNRQEVIKKHADWIVNQPELMAQLHELKGKVLGCYCAPQACHGDTLVALANKENTQMNPCEFCGFDPCVCYSLDELAAAFPEEKKEEAPVIPTDHCIELTKKGQPCKNKPKDGFTRCGPHQDKWEAENNQQMELPIKEDKEYDLPDPVRSVTPANAGVKSDTTVVIVERAQSTDEPDIFIVAGTGSRELQTVNNERKDIFIAWMTARLTRLKEKYGDSLVIMSGMAEGFDKALALLALRLGIKLWCAIPSENYGEYYWGRKSLTNRNMLPQYEEILTQAWRVTYVMPDPKGSQKYQRKYGSANFDRNDFMVDQANAFLVYDPTSSGTAQCLATIKRSGKPFELVPVV